MKVEIKIDYYNIKIYIDGLVHLCLKRNQYVGYQSWSDGNGAYKIEFYTKTNSITIEQDSKEKWVQILKALDKSKIN